MTDQTMIVQPDGSWHYRGQSGGVGATVHIPPAGMLDATNAAAFDGFVGRKVATVLQKAYLPPAAPNLAKGLPAQPDPMWVQHVRNGGRVYVSLRPPKTPSAASDAAFTACVQGMRLAFGMAGLAALTLWQEPNTNKSVESSTDTPFTPAGYLEYVWHYLPLMRAAAPGVPFAFNPALCGKTDACNADSVKAFGKALRGIGAPGYDMLLLDYYYTAKKRGSLLEDVAGFADAYDVPLGLGEFGPAASEYTFDRDEWEGDYIDYLLRFFYGRLEAGLNNGPLIAWASQLVGGSAIDLYTGAADPKCVGLRRLYDWLAG